MPQAERIRMLQIRASFCKQFEDLQVDAYTDDRNLKVLGWSDISALVLKLGDLSGSSPGTGSFGRYPRVFQWRTLHLE